MKRGIVEQGGAMRGVHWSRIGEAGFAGGMYFLLWVYRRCGRWPFRALLVFTLLWFFALRGVARRASRDYLRRLYLDSGGATPAPNGCNSFRHFMSFADAILDKLLYCGIRSDALHELPWRAEGAEHVEKLLAQRRGALLVTAHFGNVELCRRLAENDARLRLTVLVHTRHAERFNRVMRSLNPKHDVELLQVSEIGLGTAILLAQRIEEGGFVVIAGDRAPLDASRATLAHPFLGAPAHFPCGPYLLAAALGCPLLALFGARGADGFAVTILPLADHVVLPRHRRAEAIAPYLGAYADALAQACRKNPLQWFNFFPFWQSPSDAGGESGKHARENF